MRTGTRGQTLLIEAKQMTASWTAKFLNPIQMRGASHRKQTIMKPTFPTIIVLAAVNHLTVASAEADARRSQITITILSHSRGRAQVMCTPVHDRFGISQAIITKAKHARIFGVKPRFGRFSR